MTQPPTSISNAASFLSSTSRICRAGRDAPFAPARTLSSSSALNGATPVPGPTIISGAAADGGSLSVPDLSNRIGRRAPEAREPGAVSSSLVDDPGATEEGRTGCEGREIGRCESLARDGEDRLVLDDGDEEVDLAVVGLSNSHSSVGLGP